MTYINQTKFFRDNASPFSIRLDSKLDQKNDSEQATVKELLAKIREQEEQINKQQEELAQRDKALTITPSFPDTFHPIYDWYVAFWSLYMDLKTYSSIWAWNTHMCLSWSPPHLAKVDRVLIRT